MFSKMNFKNFYFLSLLFLGILTGCGDLKDNKVVKKELESERFRVDCQLNTNAFTEILKKNIGSDIRCLEENLNLFLKVVKTDKPGFLARNSIEQFVIKNRPDIKPDMVRAIKSIFDMNYLLTGEDPNYISADSIKKLIEFALIFNQRSSQHFENTFGNKKKTPLSIFKIQRDIVVDVTRELVVAIKKIFVPQRGTEVHSLNILDLLDSFSNEETREDIEKAKKLLFLKKLVLGGDQETLTHDELDFLIMNLQSFMPIIFDGLRVKNIHWRLNDLTNDSRDVLTQEKLIEILRRDVLEMDEIINHPRLSSQDKEVLFTIDELIDSVKLFTSELDFDIDKFVNIGREAKQILMGGNLVDVRGVEIKALMGHLKSLLKTSSAFHSFYKSEVFNKVLTSPQPVRIDLTQYGHVFPGLFDELTHFDRIAKNYRYYIGTFQAPFYETGIKRNADGMVEVYLLEYAIKLMFKTFGAPSPNADNVFGYSIDQFQLQALFKKFQKDLIKLDLLSPLWPTITTDNVALMGTLFQSQSDNNQVMDVNEATEFGINLITTLTMADYMFDYFKQKGCEFDEFGRVTPECIKSYFFTSLCTKYNNHLPLFFSSIGRRDTCESIPQNAFNLEFLDKSAKAARVCSYYTDGEKEEINYSESDVSTMLMVMLHSETTVIRWDKNKDNILNADEVNSAYSIYGPALDGFLITKPAIIQKFKKQIYQYLIKFEEVPNETQFKSIWKFIKFLMSFNKESPATRKTITSVLKTIGDENAKLPTAPQIDCNYLREPTTIPRASGTFNTGETVGGPDYSGLLNNFLDYID